MKIASIEENQTITSNCEWQSEFDTLKEGNRLEYGLSKIFMTSDQGLIEL